MKLLTFVILAFSWQISAMTEPVLVCGMVAYSNYSYCQLHFKECCTNYMANLEVPNSFGEGQWFVDKTEPKKLIRYCELNMIEKKSTKSVFRALENYIQKHSPQVLILAEEILLACMRLTDDKQIQGLKSVLDKAKEKDTLVLYPLGPLYTCPGEMFGKNVHVIYPNLVFVSKFDKAPYLERKNSMLVDLLAPNKKEINGCYNELSYVAEIAAAIRARHPELSAADVRRILVDSSNKTNKEIQATQPNGGIFDPAQALLLSSTYHK
jgi:hypothetical protein